MTLADAMRLTEIMLALALIQHSTEHMCGRADERWLFGVRIGLCGALAIGVVTSYVLLALVGVGLLILWRFQGPYNGGSDRMGLLVLCCLCAATWLPPHFKPYAMGYLAVQVVLSYVISGWVKIVNPDWRLGVALQDVFVFSAYPASNSLRSWSQCPNVLTTMSWGVMVFELCFPLFLFSPFTLTVGLMIAASFHFANACLFGLNRFFWIWLAAYPSLYWFQARVVGGGF